MNQPRRIEDAIQRALVKWIREECPSIHIIATRNEDSRKFVGMGVDVGVTDLILMKKRDDILQVLFLEMKTKRGKLSESQKEWKTGKYDLLLNSNNTQYDVAYGFENAKEKILDWLCIFPVD